MPWARLPAFSGDAQRLWASAPRSPWQECPSILGSRQVACAKLSRQTGSLQAQHAVRALGVPLRVVCPPSVVHSPVWCHTSMWCDSVRLCFRDWEFCS